MKDFKLNFLDKTLNWEKVFALGDKINRDLGLTEQEIINDVANFRKRKKI